jgi:hypothetical protein
MFYYIKGNKIIMKKMAFLLTAIFFGCSLVLSQDLVEAAKKEKERRARLNKKSVITVTNADLYGKVKAGHLNTSPSEERVQENQGTISQKTQRTIPPKPRNLPKKMPSQNLDNLDQMDLRMDKVDKLEMTEAQEFSREFATQVLSSTEFVENPQLALDEPDGKFAQIGEFGSLDLEIDIENGDGDDIAIYAKRQKEGLENESRNYGVFVEWKGEWEFIGFGGGIQSPETFDLGEIQSVKKIRLLFKDFTRSMWTVKPYQNQDMTYSMGIDAVKCLHK